MYVCVPYLSELAPGAYLIVDSLRGRLFEGALIRGRRLLIFVCFLYSYASCSRILLVLVNFLFSYPSLYRILLVIVSFFISYASCSHTVLPRLSAHPRISAPLKIVSTNKRPGR